MRAVCVALMVNLHGNLRDIRSTVNLSGDANDRRARSREHALLVLRPRSCIESRKT
jgi:hypothetical protein